jgi:hypothetical protein
MIKRTFQMLMPAAAVACLSLTGCGQSESTGSETGSADDTSSGEGSGADTDNESGDGSSTSASTSGGSTGSSTTTGGDGDGGDSTTGTFLDVDMPVSNGACVPGKADDCDEGEKCSAYVQEPGYCCVDTNACVPIIGDKQWGDECERTAMNDDCDNTLFCMTTTSGSTGLGVCLQLCQQAEAGACANAGLPNADCISFNDGVLPLCEDPCDPLAQDCDENWGCYAVGTQGFACALPGIEDGQGNDADECFTVQSCKPGLVCTDGTTVANCNAGSCCTQFCDTNNGNSECTDAGEECVAYFEAGMAPPGYANVGVCSIPA